MTFTGRSAAAANRGLSDRRLLLHLPLRRPSMRHWIIPAIFEIATLALFVAAAAALTVGTLHVR